METHDEFEERIRREQQVAARLRLATERLEEAQRERIWAIVEAHQSGLSVRQIAAAAGLTGYPVTYHHRKMLSNQEVRRIHQQRSMPQCVSPIPPT
jgi:DNA-binding NarL/FixJ family response regulator